MGNILHIFKKYNIVVSFEEFNTMVFDKDDYIDTNHSYSTVDKIQDIFSDIGIKFPFFNTTELDEGDIESLIIPEEMVKICDLLLQRDDIFKLYDAEYTKDYISYFKLMSEQGYYLLYDADC